jgi:hypothetical protein
VVIGLGGRAQFGCRSVGEAAARLRCANSTGSGCPVRNAAFHGCDATVEHGGFGQRFLNLMRRGGGEILLRDFVTPLSEYLLLRFWDTVDPFSSWIQIPFTARSAFFQ